MNDDEVVDDVTIRDDCQLLRRIPTKFKLNIIWDDNIQRWRPSSASFENHPNGTPMSVVLMDDLENSGRSVTEVINDPDEFALAAITAGCARMNNQKVIRDPLPEEPAHGLVVGNKTKSCRRNFAKEAIWIVEPKNKN